MTNLKEYWSNVWQTRSGSVPNIDHVVVNFSFGTGSYCAARRMVEEFGVKKVILVFADVKSEDEDTYAWGRAAAAQLGCRLVEIADGRSVWELFEQHGFIGNSRVALCSSTLKRDLIDKWCAEMFNPNRTLLVLGLHWSESDRFVRVDRKTGKALGIYNRLRNLGWRYVRAPMCELPLIGYDEMERWVKDAGLWRQRLYELGFPHANCGGQCVKQGQKGWALLYKTMPERFIARAEWERQMREKLGNVSILTESSGGVRRPLPLLELKHRIDEGNGCDESDGLGGCSCFAGDD